MNISQLIAKSENGLSDAIKLFLKVVGPGLVVMLADTDVGSIVTAAQSGVMFGYKMIIVQIILIPLLYIIQELTLRLGIVTKKGHITLILEHFGKSWAMISIVSLVICCIGAIITEFSGIIGIGMLFGMPARYSMTLTILFFGVLGFMNNYTSIERIALFCGLFEFIYVMIAWKVHPSTAEIVQHTLRGNILDGNFLYILSANIGAVIMPWMIFYQQSAVIDKKLQIQHMKMSRFETACGAVITQLIMSAVIVVVAATIGKSKCNLPLDNVQEISSAITGFVGMGLGRLLFSLGILGAALIATIVVLMTVSSSIGEFFGKKYSLQDGRKKSTLFRIVYFFILILSGSLILTDINLVKINVAVEVMNALFLPIVLITLGTIAFRALSSSVFALGKVYKIIVGVAVVLVSVFGLVSGIIGIVYK